METPKCFRVYLQFPFGGWRITLYLRCKPVFALPIAYPDLAEEYLLADKAHKLLSLSIPRVAPTSRYHRPSSTRSPGYGPRYQKAA